MQKKSLATSDYKELVDEVKGTLTEAVFNSRWTLIEGYHKVGSLLRGYQTGSDVRMTDLVNKCAVDMGVSERKLYYSVQFFDKYPDINTLPDGKNISWSKIKTKYLPETTKDKPEVERCEKCGQVLR